MKDEMKSNNILLELIVWKNKLLELVKEIEDPDLSLKFIAMLKALSKIEEKI